MRETKNQIDDLMNEIRARTEAGERTLVTTLTKKMSEDLTDYLMEYGVRVRYLHSEVDTLERIQIIRELRLGEYDVLVGVNLLREGLDLPEVSLVAILDADKEGFLRGETSLIQTIGRAARNIRGKVIMYADKETAAMRTAISETDRRREIQLAYNEEHGITPETIKKGVSDIADFLATESKVPRGRGTAPLGGRGGHVGARRSSRTLVELEEEMLAAAEDLRFEYAAKLRDEIKALRRELDEIEAEASRAPVRSYGYQTGSAARRNGQGGRRWSLTQVDRARGLLPGAARLRPRGGRPPPGRDRGCRRGAADARQDVGAPGRHGRPGAAAAQVRSIVEAAESSAAAIEAEAPSGRPSARPATQRRPAGQTARRPTPRRGARGEGAGGHRRACRGRADSGRIRPRRAGRRAAAADRRRHGGRARERRVAGVRAGGHAVGPRRLAMQRRRRDRGRARRGVPSRARRRGGADADARRGRRREPRRPARGSRGRRGGQASPPRTAPADPPEPPAATSAERLRRAHA